VDERAAGFGRDGRSPGGVLFGRAMADQAAKPKSLSDKQRLWLDAYLGEARFNASEAARRAGYSDPEQSGYDNKKNLAIRARIEERLAESSLSAPEVLAELTDIARADWREFVQVKVNPRTGETIEVRMDLTNKVRSLELLGKHHQLFSENLNINGGIEIREYVGIPEDAP
jgi:phage terminase small subunit